MKAKKKIKLCIRCKQEATIVEKKGVPACCDNCYEKIMSWQAARLYLPFEFTTELKNWEHESVMDALTSKYNRISIEEYDMKISEYSELVEAYETALKKKSEVVLFKDCIFSVKETNDFIIGCENVIK